MRRILYGYWSLSCSYSWKEFFASILREVKSLGLLTGNLRVRVLLDMSWLRFIITNLLRYSLEYFLLIEITNERWSCSRILKISLTLLSLPIEKTAWLEVSMILVLIEALGKPIWLLSYVCLLWSCHHLLALILEKHILFLFMWFDIKILRLWREIIPVNSLLWSLL